MKKEVLEHYEGIAGKFTDLSNQYCNERYRREISSFIGKEDSVLDIGCGTGLLLSKLEAKKRVGVDLSAALLSQLKKKELNLIRADAERLPFKERTFDVAYSVNLLEHVPHPAQVVSEGMRVLKNGGKLILITPNGDMSLFLEIADRLKLKAPEGPHKFLGSRRMKSLIKREMKDSARIAKYNKFVLVPKGPKKLLRLAERLERGLPFGFFHILVLEKI